MSNFDSYFMKRVLPLDKRIKTISRAIETKDVELSILKNCYENLLQEFKEIVGPKQFAKYVQKASMLPDEQDLTDEEMLILLKLFDFSIPLPEVDSETTEKVIKLKTLIQESDFRSLMKSSEIKTLVRSPEFYLMVNNDNFRDLMTQERLMSLVKSSEFKDLLYNPDFKAILARSGLVLPLKLDLQMPFSISILKSIMRLERIFEDFRVNRCAPYSPIKTFKPVRSNLARSLSPRRTPAGLSKSPTYDSLAIKDKTFTGDLSLNIMLKLTSNKTGLEESR